MMFKEIIAVYAENRIEHISTKLKLLIVEVAGTYSYHSALKG
jgi:hypothetical protein